MDGAAATWQSLTMPSETSDRPEIAPPALVLLVEDSAIIAMNTETLLLELDVGAVRTAASVAEALALIEAEPFDLAILDFNLGSENCLPIAERLVAEQVPIVFATGFGDDLKINSAWSTAPVLKKPYGFADLERIIRGV